MKEILLVTSGKGGVGKSTLSALISLKLSSRKKVLIIDSDLGLNNLDIIFNIKSNQYDILDVVKGRCNLSDAFIKVKENLCLLNLCISINVDKYPDDLLEAIIEYVKDEFEYIIIDSPAGIEKGFNNALKVANKVVVVLNDELTSYEDARKIKRLCSINNIKNIIYVMNRFNKKESVKEYIRTRITHYLSEKNLLYINSIQGSIYKKFRILSHDKEFLKLIFQINNGNVVKVF